MFEGGIPQAIWGDIFLAAGLGAVVYELYKIATGGLTLDAPAVYVDAAFFITAIILLSMGSSMKQAR